MQTLKYEIQASIGMKYKTLLLYTLALLACGLQGSALIDLNGRWISTKIEQCNNDTTCNGWVIEFHNDGTYSEEIDNEFGILELRNGKFSLTEDKLVLYQSNATEADDFIVSADQKTLAIQKFHKRQSVIKALFIKSDETHPALAKLPKLPQSKTEAITLLKSKLTADQLDELMSCPKDELIGTYHFGLGLYIRNAFRLWSGNSTLILELSHGKQTHPDELSSIIIEALWEDLQQQRKDYTEYKTLSDLYDTLEIPATPIRNLTARELITILNDRIDESLKQTNRDPNSLNLILKEEQQEDNYKLNTLPLLKIWGQSKSNTTPLHRCLVGFSKTIHTPNEIHLESLNHTTGPSIECNNVNYTKIDYENDFFEISTEDSTSSSDLSSGFPGVYRESIWFMQARESFLNPVEIIKIFNKINSNNDVGIINKISTSETTTDTITNHTYTISSYIRPANDFQPKGFKEFGHLRFKNDLEITTSSKGYQFDAKSLWIDLNSPPKLSRESAIEILKQYLTSEFKTTGSVTENSASLRRVDFTNYWFYEIRLKLSDDSNVADVRGFVTLSGDVIPFRHQIFDLF